MTDLVERLRAMNRPYDACEPPPRQEIARRATRRTVRAGTVTGTALASVVALALTLTGPGAAHSVREVATPTSSTPSPTAAPAPHPSDGTPVPGGTDGSAPAPRPGRPAPSDPALPTLLPTGLPDPVKTLFPPSPTASPTPPPASGYPDPVFWRGTYGASPYFARQIVADAPDNVCPPREPGPIDPLLGGIRYCSRFVVQPSTLHGGDYLAELAFCLAPESTGPQTYGTDGGTEVTYDVVDFDTQQTVRTWQQPASYAATRFTLQPGDCAFYVWHQPMVKSDGTPFTAGHRHHMNFHHVGAGEGIGEEFYAP